MFKMLTVRSTFVVKEQNENKMFYHRIKTYDVHCIRTSEVYRIKTSEVHVHCIKTFEVLWMKTSEVPLDKDL